MRRNTFPCWTLALLVLTATVRAGPEPVDGVFHAHPGEAIQPALDAAAAHPTAKKVLVHSGVYRPRRKAQAMVWFNARHDGITLEASGKVTLTAANPEIANEKAASFPAVVNHVVFFGDGVSRATVLRGFDITGANHFVTQAGQIEPDSPLQELKKGLFFYADGGAIKIFGRSYPTLEDLEIHDNYASPCAAGISVEHRGFNEQAVLIKDSIFRNNRAQITGSAVDLLQGSSAVIENSLFVGNVSNTGIDYVSLLGSEYNRKHGSGAITVFRDSILTVRNSTFTGNWNGIDDKGTGNIYENNIFWHNDFGGGPAPHITSMEQIEALGLNPLEQYRIVTMDRGTGGISPGRRYEFDIEDGSGVRNCLISGDIEDLQNSIDPDRNVMNGPDPEFDENFVPRNPLYSDMGYRPAEATGS